MGSSEYMKEWRKTEAGREAMAKAREKASIREKALRELGRTYPEELEELIERYENLAAVEKELGVDG